MRKVLIIFIILLLLVLVYFSSFKGIQIGNFKISSIEQLKQSSDDLDSKIRQGNSLKETEYKNKIDGLKLASNKLKEAKEEYLNYTSLSSDEEILKAMQQESYSIEFLWTKIGNHATSEGVNLKFEIVSSSVGANNTNDLNFTVQGTYIGITNFIYAIENDQDLNFRIQNFKLLPNDGNILLGTFTVSNVGIQGNTSNAQVQQRVEENVDANSNINTTNNNANNTSTVQNSNNHDANTIQNTVDQTADTQANTNQANIQ